MCLEVKLREYSLYLFSLWKAIMIQFVVAARVLFT